MSAPPITVPQANPGAAYRALQAEIDAAVARVLQSGWYILGDEARAFEAEFAAWLGTAAAVGCGNGTDALALALRGLGVGPGSSVVTVSHTAVATVAAIEMTGATPVLIDIEPDFYTMDPDELAAVLAQPPPGLPAVRAVIAVHLYGQPAALDRIDAACRRHGIALIEDCAQAHGATYAGRKVGTFSAVSAFSFYPTKNLGALGDAGIVAVSDATLAPEIAALRQYGWRTHYVSDTVGVNSRLDELQAAILRVKLRHLEKENTQRRALAAVYEDRLRRTKLRLPVVAEGFLHVYHQYVIRSEKREELRVVLDKHGVGAQIHYPLPLHRQPAYRHLKAMCPVTDQIAGEILSLPMHAQLSRREVDKVCELIVAHSS